MVAALVSLEEETVYKNIISCATMYYVQMKTVVSCKVMVSSFLAV